MIIENVRRVGSVVGCESCGLVAERLQGSVEYAPPIGSPCPACLERAVVVPDPINNPAHYQANDPVYEPINVIEAWGLGFHLGNAVKYIARAGRKGDRAEDLKKARWYLDRELGREGGNGC